LTTRKRILVVGAGFAGAVHARELAEAGFDIDVLDRRGHVGGNAYDEVCATGQLVHRYGPHLFHTNNERVVRWLRRFSEFVPYEHRVQALLADGRRVPLPVNRTTINEVFGLRLHDEHAVRDFLRTLGEINHAPANAAAFLNASIGRVLTDLFFRPYTRKMWALDLEDLDASVVKRIPIRFDDESRYFPDDRFQMMPRDGYAQLFEAILDHPRIAVTLNQLFDATLLSGYTHCFSSMPIDEFFACRFGALPYRSIRFHHDVRAVCSGSHAAATVNFTDDGPLTRETDWSLLPGRPGLNQPGSGGPLKTVTREEPCDYLENDLERYYPVKTSDGRHQATYARYKALADATPGISFIGRCGTYQYLDMHQVINQSLTQVRAWVLGASAPLAA
jgi:UDP-galactopyranose mutase